MGTQLTFGEDLRHVSFDLAEGADPLITVEGADVMPAEIKGGDNGWILYELRPPAEVEEDLENVTDSELQDQRDDIKNKLAVLSAEETELKARRADIDEEFQRRFKERGVTTTKSDRFTTYTVTDDKYPVLVDREAFQQFVLTTKSLHFLQNRLALGAIQEEIAAGGKVPGVEITKKTTINQRKR